MKYTWMTHWGEGVAVELTRVSDNSFEERAADLPNGVATIDSKYSPAFYSLLCEVEKGTRTSISDKDIDDVINAHFKATEGKCMCEDCLAIHYMCESMEREEEQWDREKARFSLEDERKAEAMAGCHR